MLLKIVQSGDRVLRDRARVLSANEIRSKFIQELIDSMRETMRDAPGVGLAAPQIGEPLQLAVIEDRAEYQRNVKAERLALLERRPVPFHVIANPKLTVLQTQPDTGRPAFFEGCLSLSGLVAVVPRALEVRVDALDEHGRPVHIEARGWHARILQHEIDHLQGVLYVDRAYTRTLMTQESYAEHWGAESMEEVFEGLDPKRSVPPDFTGS
jgi:peptide deformylase